MSPARLDAVARALDIVETVKPILAGHGGEVQGAALMQLLALYIAGHPAQIRERVLAHHVEAVRGMVPIAEAELFGADGHPGSRS